MWLFVLMSQQGKLVECMGIMLMDGKISGFSLLWKLLSAWREPKNCLWEACQQSHSPRSLFWVSDGSGAICGFLWPLLQCHRHGQGSGTRLQNPRAHKTPKCSSASQAACWKQDSSATLCLSPLMPWSVSLSLCLLCLVHWHVGTMTISYSCLASITFSLPHRMFAWSQWNHKLILLYF